MRSESQIYDLIVSVAQADPRIRAAYVEGSRANPKEPRDMFQDYDIGFVVTDTAPFVEDRSWIDRFGERLIMQYPDEFGDEPCDHSNWYCWLMLFTDGVRIDLHVMPTSALSERLELYRTLVDKDGIMPDGGMTSDERYWVQRPSRKAFADTCNEFCWCLNNVAKGLRRGQLPFVMDHLDDVVRPMLFRLLTWRAGIDHDFAVSVGKAGKYLRLYVSDDYYRRYLATYTRADVDAVWNAIDPMIDLFDDVARSVAADLDFAYDVSQTEAIRGFMARVRALPPAATDFTPLTRTSR